MRVKTQVIGGTKFSHRLREIQQKLSKNNAVYVGIPKATQPYEDGTQLAVIAAAHEFGADIDHPGGVPYGYGTQKDAEEGKVRFLKKGQGFMVLGETKPHKIKIPERSFLRNPLRGSQKKIALAFRKTMKMVMKGELTMFQALSQIGAKGASISQEAISAGIDPPNSPETIARKGSSTPLVDQGRLRQAITHVVEGQDVT